MAALHLLPSFLFLLFAYSGVRSETIICDSSRFANLTLDMTNFTFCDKTLPFYTRAKDLVDRMTLSEKVAQLGNTAKGVPRLGLPSYEWWSEALHGVSDVGPGTHFDQNVLSATSFPNVILTAASFNETLWKTIGQVVSNEARALYNLGLAGLTFWSPNINVARDPRWGRILETPGEDPFLVGRYAINYVRGLQDVNGFETAQDLNSRPLKVAACCKHYAAYDVDNWKGVDRYHFDARVTERDMVETFVLPFEMCVKEGDVASVMCSYNRVNGIPSCADPRLLNQTVRGRWNLHGYIVADCDSIEVMHHGHKFLNDTPEEAVAQTLKAGLDLDCGIYYPDYTALAIKKGLVEEDVVDKSLINLYVVLLRLGWFDGSSGSYAALGKQDVCTEQNLELSAEAAREGIVLLKNDKNTLPLKISGRPKYAVVGPHANATVAMIGNYALKTGVACRYITPLDGLAAHGDAIYSRGCFTVKCYNGSLIGPAAEVAKGADATFIFVGLDLTVEAESLDRNDLLLPSNQKELINQVSASATGPVILVIFSAGGIDISFAKDNPKISAILWAGYPGAEGGRAIADVIFGNYNPGGRLPITWYTADYVNTLPMTSMQLRPIPELSYPGRTYKFFNGPTVYPFGYGLSYTSFDYTIISAPSVLTVNLLKLQQCKQITYAPGTQSSSKCPAVQVQDSKCKEVVKITVEVRNTGKRDGPNVVTVYSVSPSNIVGAPIKRVVGFARVFLRVGERQKLKFVLNACKSFSIVDEEAYTLLPSGVHTIVIGDGADAISAPMSVMFQYGRVRL